MIIQVTTGDETKYYLVPEHAEVKMVDRGIGEAMIAAALKDPDSVELNPKGRWEYLQYNLKVVVDDDPDYDGVVVTAYFI